VTIVPGTSFSFTLGTIASGQACYKFWIIN
jgi:hypothetical protein